MLVIGWGWCCINCLHCVFIVRYIQLMSSLISNRPAKVQVSLLPTSANTKTRKAKEIIQPVIGQQVAPDLETK